MRYLSARNVSASLSASKTKYRSFDPVDDDRTVSPSISVAQDLPRGGKAMVGAIINGVATRLPPLLDEGRGHHILPNGYAIVN